MEQYVYSYDAEGLLTLEEHYYGSKRNDSTSYEYDGKGRLLRKTTTYGKTEGDRSTYEYKDL